MAIEETLEQILKAHSKRLIPESRRVTVHTKLKSNRKIPLNNRLRTMGSFFESITGAFYGGIVTNGNSSFVYNPEPEHTIKPDVIDYERRILYESKGCVSTRPKRDKSPLIDDQTNGYIALQTANPDWKIYYAFYAHLLKGINSTWHNTPNKLFEQLSQLTRFSVVLPFSVIIELYNPSSEHKLSRRYVKKRDSNSTFDNSTCVYASALEMFLSSPEKALEVLGLSPDRFSIEYYISPSRIRVNGFRLGTFPITRILDNDYESFVRTLTQDYSHQYRDCEKIKLPNQEVPF